MSVEDNIYLALKDLAATRVFRDFAPLSTAKPYITFVQIGGEAYTYVGPEVPNIQNGRFQINVWGSTRAQCSALMLQVESAMTLATAFIAKPLGAPSGSYDHDSQIYASMQDFSVISNR